MRITSVSRAFAVALTTIAVALTASIPAAADTPAPVPSFTEATQFSDPDGYKTGYSVDIDGSYAIFTADRSEVDGRVTIAERTGPGGSDWTQTTLRSPAGVTRFGQQVAIDAEKQRAVVTGFDTPHLYVYERRADGTWPLTRTIDAPSIDGNGPGRNFGEIMLLRGDVVAVGLPNAIVDGKRDAGAVNLFDLETGAAQVVTAPQPTASSIFGQSIALSDAGLAVASPQTNGTYNRDEWGATVFRVGKVDLYRLAEGRAVHTRTIDYPLSSYTMPAERSSVRPFGISMALTHDRLYVAAPAEINFRSAEAGTPDSLSPDAINDGNTTQGAVYVFDATTGKQIGGKIVAPQNSWAFGLSLAADDERVLASAYDEQPDTSGMGQVYVLDTADLGGSGDDLGRVQALPSQMLRPDKTPKDSYFGSQSGSQNGGGIAISGSSAIIGSSIMGGTGRVNLFALRTPRTVTSADQRVFYGEPAALTATIDSDGDDSGAVTFTVAGTERPSAAVTGRRGTSIIDAASLDAAEYPFTVLYTSASGDEASASGTLTIAPDTTQVRAGVDGATLTGAVSSDHGTPPSGSVTVTRDGTEVASAQLDDAGEFAVTGLSPDDATYLVQYSGDTNHEPSSVDAEIAAVTPPMHDPDAGGDDTDTPRDPDAGGDDTDTPLDAPPAQKPSPHGGDLAATGWQVPLGVITLALALLSGGAALLRIRRRPTLR